MPESKMVQPANNSVDKAARALQLAVAAAQTADENRGQNIAVLDVRQLTCMFDYFVIATGASRRQLHAMSEEIDHKLEDDLNDQRMGIEGYSESRWILLDYGSVVIHLFDQETRDFFAIEEMWAEAPRIAWERESSQS
ncbi:MAG: ribosome silencing factor [Pirellulaceae bacterium]|nr:ribosome silencing factor [Pirellulaceae bacterium]